MRNNTYNELLDEMLLAISANIEYLKNNGSSQIYIKNGRLINALGGSFVYKFDLSILQDLEPESDIEVKIKNRIYSGKIISIIDQQIQIALEESLGDSIASATLVISSYFLLEKLRDHLSNIKTGTIKHSNLSEKIFGIEKNEPEIDMSYSADAINQLDEFQEKAVRTVLGSDVTFMWGPPGTGKSKTIASLLQELIDRGKSVLLIAHTNAATDSVLGKVVEVMENHPVYLDGKILRVGNPKAIDSKLQLANVMPEVIMAQKAKPITDEIARLIDEQITLELKIANYLRLEADIEKISELNAGLKSSKMQFEIISNESTAYINKFENERSSLSYINGEMRTFQNKGTLSKIFSGTSLEKLSFQKTEILNLINRLEAQIKNLDIKKENIHTATARLIAKRIELEKKIEASTFKYSENDLIHTKKSLVNSSDEIKVLEKQLASLGEDLFSEAQVIVTTLTKSYMHKPIISRQFDCIILDEASMAPLPAIASVSGLAKEKVVLVGDFYQLPPIAKHSVDRKSKTDEEAEKEVRLVDEWLKRDIFKMAGIESAVRNGRMPDEGWLVQLKKQYRMHPDISDVINKLIYAKNGDLFKLIDANKILDSGHVLLSQTPLADGHIGVYDTSSLGSVPAKSDGGSTYNLTHALLAVQMAKDALENGYEHVGIISAYRAQVNLINKIILDELGEDDRVVADTVHRFQGGAMQVIIFDITTPYSNTMYDDTKEDGDDEKLLNVAFSRAEEKCIILADCKIIKSKHSDSSLVRGVLSLCANSNRPFVDASTLLRGYRADDRTDQWLARLNDVDNLEEEIYNSQLFDELDFYSYFHKDLIKAKQEVIIQSAFITVSRVERMMPIFRHLVRKGIRLFILTRIPEDNTGLMVEQSKMGMKMLEDIGATVLPFKGKIHQKFAIVDREIMWEGSLNILSQRDSQETMRRVVGVATATQYMEFHKLDKNIGPLGSNNLRHCDVCKKSGSWMWTARSSFGYMRTYCLTGNHAPGKPPVTDADIRSKEKAKIAFADKASKIRRLVKLDSDANPVCPMHERIMVEKTGRFGQYWECPMKRECGCTISPAQLKRL